MKISYNWLKWYIPDAPEAQKLADVITYHLTEVEGVEKLADGDIILDINILPNRAHDLLSHQGVAKELSGQLGIKFNDPTEMYKIPEVTNPEGKSTSDGAGLKIEIATDKCRRYMGRIIRNIKVGPSPDWVVKHLESIGQRSINNIVDATNIVMYDCGQPCHAYDLAKLSGEKIVITNAKEGDELPVVGREGIVAKLKETDLVISDGVKNLALAGVKGGLDSGINENTTDIVLEVANFNPTSVRKTARRLGLLSDSAKRFENDLSAEHTAYAMRELTALFLDPLMHCGDAVFEEIVDIYPVKQEERKISFTTDFVNKKVGGNITNDEVEQILKNYNFLYKNDKGSFEVVVPSLRFDLENPIDMAEEIGRIYGYDKLVPVLPKISFEPKQNETYQKIQTIRNHLTSVGCREVMTYAFGKKGEVEVMASASDKNFLRTNLTDGLKASFEINRLNAPLLGIDIVKIFEIGTVFKKDKEEIYIGCVDKKGVVEMSLDEYIKNNNLDYKNFESKNYNLETRNFNSWSVYPFIVRDLSLWVTSDSDKDIVLEIIKNEGKELLIKEPQILDRFEKEGKISFAFRMIFQSNDRTLADIEINQIIENITAKVTEKGYIPR